MDDISVFKNQMEKEVLIKFGKYQHMKELIENGVVYMNTLEFYRTLECNDERRDENEGVVKIRNLLGGTLRMMDPKTGLYRDAASLTHSTIRELNSNIQYLNVYCLYYCKLVIPVESLGHMVVDRVKTAFGQYAVIIVDPQSFVIRVKAAAEEKGYKHFRKLVEYVDLKVEEAEVGPFVKHHSYAHQNELRIAVHTGNRQNNPVRLEIGNISDIAILLPSDALNEISIIENGG